MLFVIRKQAVNRLKNNNRRNKRKKKQIETKCWVRNKTQITRERKKTKQELIEFKNYIVNIMRTHSPNHTDKHNQKNEQVKKTKLNDQTYTCQPR